MPKGLNSRILEASMGTDSQLVPDLHCEAPHVSKIPRDIFYKQTLEKFKYIGSVVVVSIH